MLPPLEMTSMGSVSWNGNVVANTLDLGLDLDLTSAVGYRAFLATRSGTVKYFV